MTGSCERAPDAVLNMNVRGLEVSATIAIHERCRRLEGGGRRVVRLGLGQSPFPVPRCVVEELRRHAHEKAYLPVRGLPALREAVAEHHSRTFGIDCSPESVLVGPGSKELMFLLQLVYYGELVIPTPAWVSYAPQARIIGRSIRLVPTRREDRFRLTAERLDALCREDPGRPRIVVLNYPSNPTGGTYGVEELRALAEVAARHRIVVLSDEIYGKLHHEGKHASMVPFYPEGTVFSGGLSKWCGAGGWRLGVFVVPPCMGWLLEAMAAVASETFTSTSAPIQHAAVRAFDGRGGEGDEIESYLRSCRRVLRALGGRVAGILGGAGVRVLPPEGGFYLFPDFSPQGPLLAERGIETSAALCERLLEDTGVAILPGSEFGRPAGELTARLAYVDFDGGRALEAAAAHPEGGALGDDFLEEHCAPTLEAARRIAAWLPGAPPA